MTSRIKLDGELAGGSGPRGLPTDVDIHRIFELSKQFMCLFVLRFIE